MNAVTIVNICSSELGPVPMELCSNHNGASSIPRPSTVVVEYTILSIRFSLLYIVVLLDYGVARLAGIVLFLNTGLTLLS